MATKPKQKAGVTATFLAAHIDMSRQRVAALVDERVFEQHADGTFDLDACRVAYIRWLRDEGRRSSKSASQSRVSDARAREIELRVAERERRLAPVEDTIAFVDFILGPVPSELASVAPMATDDISIRRKIENGIDGVCAGISKRLRKASADLRSGRDVLDTGPAIEPDRVVGEEQELSF